MLEALKEQVWKANVELGRSGLVTLTWGNVSGFDHETQLMAMKPSGVPYEELKPEHIVLLDLRGRVVEGDLNPSSDTPTHLVLYAHFPKLGGITHTHSVYATMFAQAGRELPCFGTTHADHFYGTVPVTRMLTDKEVHEDYTGCTGQVILERFGTDIKPMAMPAVLVRNHGPFTWGKDAMDSVHNSIALECVAKMAYGTLFLNSASQPIPQYLLDKHYHRKHGVKATYGQKPKNSAS